MAICNDGRNGRDERRAIQRAVSMHSGHVKSPCQAKAGLNQLNYNPRKNPKETLGYQY